MILFIPSQEEKDIIILFWSPKKWQWSKYKVKKLKYHILFLDVRFSIFILEQTNLSFTLKGSTLDSKALYITDDFIFKARS